MPRPSRLLSVRAAAPLVLAWVLTGACSAVDDFTVFRFVDDGGAPDAQPRADLAVSMTGNPCAASGCTGGLSCFTTVGNANFPGGVCSSACSPNAPSCPTGSSCGQVEGTSLCLQACNPASGAGCRAGWSCCDGQRVVLGAGVCAPSSTNFCGH